MNSWDNQELETQETEAENQSKGLKIGWVVRLAQRYSLLIAGITVMSTTAAYFVASNRSPTYQSFFQILVEPVSTEGQLSQPTAVTRGQRAAISPTLDYETQIEILKSPDLLEPVIKEIQKFAPNFGMINLRQNLIVERLGRDLRIIQVAYQGSNPQLVDLVLNKLAEKYLRYSLEERKSSISEGVVFIDDQLPEIRKRSDTLQKELQDLQQEHSFFNPQQEGQEISSQVRQLTEQIVDTQRQLEEQQILYQNLGEQLGLKPEEALAASALSEDPVYQNIIQQLEEIERQIAIELTRFRENSPTIDTLKSQRDNLRPLLEERARKTLGSRLRNQLDNVEVQSFQSSTRVALIRQLISARNSLEQLSVRINALTNRRNSLEKELEKFPALARRYAEITRDLEIVNTTLNQLLSEREKLKVEAAQKNIPWELIYEPQVPQAQPQSSEKLLGAGVVGGLGLGMVLAFLIDRRKGTFTTVEDIEDATDFPVLEVIPSATKPSEIPEELAEENDFVEAFNALYAKLLFFYPDPPLKSLLISSPGHGDGKTTIGIYLAKSIAATGKKVLLVDADLRNPTLHQRLGLQNEQGLKQLLSSPHEAKKQRLIQKLPETENLFLLASGGASSEGAQLLASEQMKRLMEKFEQSFDFIIYDSSPLEGYTDGKFIAPNTDGVLLVVQPNHTKRKFLKSSIEELESFKIQILGLIANEGGDGIKEEKVFSSSKVSVNN